MIRRLPPRSRPLLVVALVAASTAHAQITIGPTIPSESGPEDVGEVEEIVPESEYLPADEVSPLEEDEATSRNLDKISRSQAKELAYSAEEIRSRHEYGVALGVGSAKPWTLFSVETNVLYRPDVEFGLYAGGGNFSDSGMIDEKSYDTHINARTAGVSSRFHFSRLEGVSVEGLLAYGAWEGRISPAGSDDEEDDEEKLSASYRVNGLIFGVSVGLTWLWDNGVYLEWTPFGMRRSRLLQRDISRDALLIRQAVDTTIQSSGFYGLTNLKIGYYF